jgi:hypothetical protein
MKFFLACATIAIALIVVSVVRRTATDPWKEYKVFTISSYLPFQFSVIGKSEK